MRIVERPMAEVVARVLERIAEYRYWADEDDDGEVIAIPDYGPTFAEREEYLSEELGKLKEMRDGYPAEEDDFTLADDWSDSWTEKLLEQEPFSPEDKAELFPQLQGKSYEEVISFLYIAITKNLEEAEGLLATGRETIPKKELNDVSQALDHVFRKDMRERLSRFRARRLSRQFPKMIDRAVELALLTADHEVPDPVSRYLGEASKCYINGQRIACLMVCRSAIEFAVRDRLNTCGFGSALLTFERSSDGDSLYHLIELGKKHLAWECRAPLDDAQRVRQAAVRAVHVAPPSDDDCRESFMLTRMVLHMLYRKPGS